MNRYINHLIMFVLGMFLTSKALAGGSEITGKQCKDHLNLITSVVQTENRTSHWKLVYELGNYNNLPLSKLKEVRSDNEKAQSYIAKVKHVISECQNNCGGFPLSNGSKNWPFKCDKLEKYSVMQIRDGMAYIDENATHNQEAEEIRCSDFDAVCEDEKPEVAKSPSTESEDVVEAPVNDKPQIVKTKAKKVKTPAPINDYGVRRGSLIYYTPGKYADGGLQDTDI